MEQLFNTYGGLIMIYFIFQLGLGTYVRLLSMDFPESDYDHVSKKAYLIFLIPGFGVLYFLFYIIRIAITGKTN